MPEIEVTPEHAADPNTRRVGILVGVVGILLSVVTIASHRAHTQCGHSPHRIERPVELLPSQENPRKHRRGGTVAHAGVWAPILPRSSPPRQNSRPPAPSTPRTRKRFRRRRNAKDQETEVEEHRALCFDIGEGLLELGLVLCSLYFLARKVFFPIFGVLASLPARCWASWVSCFERRSRLGGALSPCASGCFCRRRAAAISRVEARSADLLAVGVVRDDKMIIHISRLIDNAPVRDAAVTVVLRGTAHPTTAETDGSYSLQTKDLALPGAAAVEFRVDRGAAKEASRARWISDRSRARRTTRTAAVSYGGGC